MATSSTSLATLIAPPTFTGVSKFATSLQQVLTRAVAIASLPLDSDQAALNNSTTVQGDLRGLDNTFTTLQQSIGSLQTALTSNLLGSSLSDSTTVSATLGTGATAGTYTVAVDSLGAYSTALSNAGTAPVTDPAAQGISGSSTFTLTVGGTATTITPASSGLQDLATAINAQSGGQVQATLVNVGSTSSPDYRLSLQATNLGTAAIDLTDTSGSVIATATAGTLASYSIDGTDAISSTARTVTVSPGLTVGLIGQSTG